MSGEVRYFYITNDPNPETTRIDPGDTEEVKKEKQMQQMLKDRIYATFDESTKMWSIPLPDFFRNSTNPNKSIYIESFQFFNAKGQSDIGTTIHSPSLMDGNYSQFDNIVGLATVGINREFPIQSNLDKIDFFFADYMDYTQRLPAVEYDEIQKVNEYNLPLYEAFVQDDEKEPSIVPSAFPVQNQVYVGVTNKTKNILEGQVIAWWDIKIEAEDIKLDGEYYKDINNMKFDITDEELESGDFIPIPVRWTSNGKKSITISQDGNLRYKPIVTTIELYKRLPNIFKIIFNNDKYKDVLGFENIDNINEDIINNLWGLHKVVLNTYTTEATSESDMYGKVNRKDLLNYNTHQTTNDPIEGGRRVWVDEYDDEGHKLYYQTKKIETIDKKALGATPIIELDYDNPISIRFFITARLTF